MCVELLDKYKSAIVKRREAEAELNEQLQSQTAPDMKVKLRECKDTEEQLKQVETRLGSHGFCLASIASSVCFGSFSIQQKLSFSDFLHHFCCCLNG